MLKISLKIKNLLLFQFICLSLLTGCIKAKPVKTIEDLKEGIIGETTSSAKYAAFAERAKIEGHDTIAKLFEATSKSEGIHAANYSKALKSLGEKMESFNPVYEVKTTKENLETAIDGETYETKSMYPQFLHDTRSEKAERFRLAKKSFTWGFNTELKHLAFYKEALSAIENKTENTLPFKYAICPVCGNTYDYATVDDKCAFCGNNKEMFIKIN